MIRRLGRLVASESRKALHHRLLRGTAVATVLAALLAALLVTSAHGETTGFLVVARAARVAAVLSAVTALLLGCQGIAREAGEGTLVLVLTRPVRRREVVVAKTIVTALAAVVVFAVSVALALALAAATRGFGPIASEGYVIVEPGEMSRTLVRSLALTIPALAAVAAFGLLVSSVASSGTAAVAIGLLAYVPIEIGRRLFATAELTPYVFSTYSTFFVDFAEERSRGYAVGLAGEAAWLGVLVPLASAVVLAAAASLVLARREIRY